MPIDPTEFLAHLGGDNGPQLLSEHLSGVGRRAERYAAKIGLPLAGALLGLLHDAGKATETFQSYLRSFDETSGLKPQEHLRGKIDHSTAGAQCILKELHGGKDLSDPASLAALLLALCIASHHSGLIDCLAIDGGDALTARLNRAEAQSRSGEAWRHLPPEVKSEARLLMQNPELVSQCRKKMSRVLNRSFGDGNVQLGLLVRTLFSCLIDADRSDTADYEKPRNAQHRQQGEYEPWEVLLARLDEALSSFPTEGKVNQVRANVSLQCFEAAQRPRGIYTLTVPTGGGKTLAALRFALEHARLHQLDRVVFVSPYISIVDQNAAVARRYLEPEGVPYASVVLEHHSDLARDRVQMKKRSAGEFKEQDIDGWRRRVLAENWDAPVVFTTMVQVLDALFGSGTSSVRRLHTLAKAVIVFDEVQSLPTKLVHLFNNAANFLATHCGSSILLCTATQPLLAKVDAKLGVAHLADKAELIDDVTALWKSLRRYVVLDETAGSGPPWSHEAVAERVCREAMQYGSCLVIVNTKRDARTIFEHCRTALPANATILHLSTSMCPEHRSDTLATLHQRLTTATSDTPVVCISTQLIEAGVDIDFAVVVRDLAGLDSLAQAAGRCNRHGLRTEPGRVVLVELPDPPSQLEDICEGRKAARSVLQKWHRDHPEEAIPLDSNEIMEQYYELHFFGRRNTMVYPLDAKTVGRESSMLELLGNNERSLIARSRAGKEPLSRPILQQSFSTANHAFVLIEPTQSIVVPFKEEGLIIINKLCSAQHFDVEWQLLRQAQPFSVSVRSSEFRRLESEGAIYPAPTESGVYCLRSEFYDNEFGLHEVAGTLESLIG